jgi:hypothetical protein
MTHSSSFEKGVGELVLNLTVVGRDRALDEPFSGLVRTRSELVDRGELFLRATG